MYAEHTSRANRAAAVTAYVTPLNHVVSWVASCQWCQAASLAAAAATPAAAAPCAVVSLPVPLRTAVAAMVLLILRNPTALPAAGTTGDMAQPAKQQQQQAAVEARINLKLLFRRAAATAAPFQQHSQAHTTTVVVTSSSSSSSSNSRTWGRV